MNYIATAEREVQTEKDTAIVESVKKVLRQRASLEDQQKTIIKQIADLDEWLDKIKEGDEETLKSASYPLYNINNYGSVSAEKIVANSIR